MGSFSVNKVIERSATGELKQVKHRGTGYNLKLIRSRLSAVKIARKHHDNRELLFVINEGIHGNLGGIGNADLFKRAKPETRELIHEYLNETALALHDLANSQSTDISLSEKIDLFRRASRCYGHTALMHSGAGSLTPYHIGVVKTLYENDSLPKVISGSSGGSMVAGLIGTRTPEELDALFAEGGLEDLMRESMAAFSLGDGSAKLWGFLPRLHTTETLIRIVETWIPDLTFDEAFKRSGIAINVSVTPASISGASRLLNATTSPHVYIREAVRASCSVPGVFPAVELCAKGYDGLRRPYIGGQKWVDGSVGLDLPARRLGRLYGVNHFITSQTNPAVLWAVKRAHNSGPTGRRVFDWASDIFRANLKAIRPFSGVLTAKLPWVSAVNHLFYAVAGQDYTADVTILPTRNIVGITELLSPITNAQTDALIEDGKQQILAQIELIHNCTLIRKALDEILVRFDLQAH